MKTIMFIAGEISGDRISAKIIDKIKAKFPNYRIIGMGGNAMEMAGMEQSVINMSMFSIIGYVAILKNFFKLKRGINHLIDFAMQEDPDLIITVDSPGLSEVFVRGLRGKNLESKIFHIVAPSVWAWKQGRAKKFADLYDKIFCLLPFEPQYFNKYKENVAEFIGNVSIEDIDFRSGHLTTVKTIVITLGSRKSEIARHLPLILGVAHKILQHRPECRVLLPIIPHLEDYFTEMSKIKCIKFDDINNLKTESIIGVSDNDSFRRCIKIADFCIAKSGTNTIEVAKMSIPLLVYYKLSRMNYLIVKLFIKNLKFCNLINIIANKKIIPEFIQNEANEENIFNEFIKYASNQSLRNEMMAEIKSTIQLMMNDKNKALPSQQICDFVLKCLYKT